MVAVATAVLVVPTGSGEATSGTRGPKVVCITDFYPNVDAIRAYKPRKCILHQRNTGYYTLSLAALSDMKWRSWKPGQARGKGKIAFNMVGKVPVKVKLTKPRVRCGVKVFTKARTKGAYTYMGEKYEFGGDFRLDDCA